MKKIIDWIKKFFCRSKAIKDEWKHEKVMSEERQIELWELSKKSPERYEGFEDQRYGSWPMGVGDHETKTVYWFCDEN